MAYFQNNQINPYQVGDRVYGGGRPFPTMGPVDPLGYKERDAKHKARRAALLRRLKALQQGNVGSADVQRGI